MTDASDDYEDTPAGAVESVCPVCRGAGTVAFRLIPAIPGALAGYERVERCSNCRPRPGRFNLGTGPGAKLQPWQRVPVPGVDDWGPRRS